MFARHESTLSHFSLYLSLNWPLDVGAAAFRTGADLCAEARGFGKFVGAKEETHNP